MRYLLIVLSLFLLVTNNSYAEFAGGYWSTAKGDYNEGQWEEIIGGFYPSYIGCVAWSQVTSGENIFRIDNITTISGTIVDQKIVTLPDNTTNKLVTIKYELINGKMSMSINGVSYGNIGMKGLSTQTMRFAGINPSPINYLGTENIITTLRGCMVVDSKYWAITVKSYAEETYNDGKVHRGPVNEVETTIRLATTDEKISLCGMPAPPELRIFGQ